MLVCGRWTLLECVNWTNVGLDHLAPLGSDPCDEAEYIHLPLGSHHVQHRINYDEGPRPPDTRAKRDGQNNNRTYCKLND